MSCCRGSWPSHTSRSWVRRWKRDDAPGQAASSEHRRGGSSFVSADATRRKMSSIRRSTSGHRLYMHAFVGSAPPGEVVVFGAEYGEEFSHATIFLDLRRKSQAQ